MVAIRHYLGGNFVDLVYDEVMTDYPKNGRRRSRHSGDRGTSSSRNQWHRQRRRSRKPMRLGEKKSYRCPPAIAHGESDAVGTLTLNPCQLTPCVW